MSNKKGVPRKDGSGKGVGVNRGRGGCKPIKRRGLNPIAKPSGRGGLAKKSPVTSRGGLKRVSMPMPTRGRISNARRKK